MDLPPNMYLYRLPNMAWNICKYLLSGCSFEIKQIFGVGCLELGFIASEGNHCIQQSRNWFL